MTDTHQPPPEDIFGPPVYPQWTPPPKKKSKLVRRLIVVGAIAGLIGFGATRHSSSTSSTDTPTTSYTTGQTVDASVASYAMRVQGLVCSLLGQGYTNRDIAAAIATTSGVDYATKLDFARIVGMAERNC